MEALCSGGVAGGQVAGEFETADGSAELVLLRSGFLLRPAGEGVLLHRQSVVPQTVHAKAPVADPAEARAHARHEAGVLVLMMSLMPS